MCELVTTIIGSLLMAGGAAANMKAQSQVSKARDQAFQTERQRQTGLDDRISQLNQLSNRKFEQATPQIEDRSRSLGDFIAAQQAKQQEAPSGMPASRSNLVVQEEAKQRGEARAFADRQGFALGNLRAFGDLFGDWSRQQARDNAQVGTLNNFKRGWTDNVMPWELRAADAAGDNSKMIGDVARGLGTLVMAAGAFGGAPAAAAEAGTGAAGAGIQGGGVWTGATLPKPWDVLPGKMPGPFSIPDTVRLGRF